MTAETMSAATASECLVRDGAAIVDLREAERFARGHAGGALCVPYSARRLAERVRIADPRVQAVILVTEDGDHEVASGATEQLLEGGIEVVGVARPDPAWWSETGRAWRSVVERTLDEVAGSEEFVLVDVREPMEWATGHVPGAVLIALGELHDASDSLPRDRELAVICEAGVRSATAASILLEQGFTRVCHLPLGTAEVRRTGGPMQYPDLPRPETP